MNAVGDFTPSRLRERARRVAAVAARHADAVDRDGRFPREAVEAMKAERLLGAMIPEDLGGEGAGLAAVADTCTVLGQACSASAMVFAMHQIKVSSLVEHGLDSPWHRGALERIAADQLLIASATTEGGIGGNMRNSICAVERTGDRFTLEKQATVISYGDDADGIMVTARANGEAPTTDQVMAVFFKGDYTLERTSTWDTLGMRGTCSNGYVFRGAAPVAQIIPKPFAEIAAQSMLAYAHILWSALWFGIATDAVNRARAFVRAEARKTPQTTPPGALRLAEATATLNSIRSTVLAAMERFEAAKADPDALSSVSFAVDINMVKVETSERILDVIDRCLLVCGILGYKNGTPYSLGRHLRDAHSARLMVSNERILGNTANLLLVQRQDVGLFG
ncbi:acyl-CoA dehydrogenase family protein [Mongoliimonas terrestris]|uniref:acyl-CoA dehydrogenase family protein n=1 Tax=Mongoliimonas terrestris TaxID=1709001 RepID=UPI000949913C|nr:acyl-CoA dehydrogenase family protein [Mongoliimonas terrestris]